MKPLIILALVLAALAAQARDDGKPTICSSYTAMTGTTITDCRSPGRKPTHCESYTSITGTTTTECR
jgi:hypothetical protein